MLRKAKFEDIFEIRKLIDLGARDGQVLERSTEELASVLSCFYVWEEDTRVVGCISLEVYKRSLKGNFQAELSRFPYSPKLAEIRSLVVLPEYRGKGIATKLVEKCLIDAKSKEVYEVLAITDQDSLFDKLMFRKELNNQFPMFLKLKER